MYNRGRCTGIANIAWPHRLVYTEQSSDALTASSGGGASKRISLYSRRVQAVIYNIYTIYKGVFVGITGSIDHSTRN